PHQTAQGCAFLFKSAITAAESLVSFGITLLLTFRKLRFLPSSDTLPNHISILAIIGVEILDARKRRLCDVGVISTDAEKKPGRERPLQERTITRPTKSKPISECQPLRSG